MFTHDNNLGLECLNLARDLLDRYYDIKRRGYPIEMVAKRVMEIFGVEQDLYDAARVG